MQYVFIAVNFFSVKIIVYTLLAKKMGFLYIKIIKM